MSDAVFTRRYLRYISLFTVIPTIYFIDCIFIKLVPTCLSVRSKEAAISILLGRQRYLLK